MLRILLQALAWAFLCTFNLYGASLIYYQERLLKKAGLLFLCTAVALLLHFLTRLALPQAPPVLIFSLLLFVQAALSSLLVKGHQRIFSGLHRYQLATRPKTWGAMMNAGHFSFARLFPAFGSVVQAMMIFK